MADKSLLHRVRGASEEQVTILLQGLEVWNRWREENPQEKIELSDVDLRPEAIVGQPILGSGRANLRNINLEGAVLRETRLDGADLYGARLGGACLLGAHLEGAVLQAAHLEEAILSGANLEGASLAYANLQGALLCGTQLKGASLHHANFREADLRGVQNAVFDESNVIQARFGLAAKDPWSILRRKYTGVMFVFHFMFLLVFIIPYIGRASFWKAINRGQMLYSSLSSELVEDLRRIDHDRELARDQWRERVRLELADLGLDDDKMQRIRELVDEGVAAEVGGLQGSLSKRISDRLDAVGPCLQENCIDTPVWRILLQLDKSPRAAFLALSLLLYNVLRGLLTWQLGLMRDEEERSGLTPPWRSIRLRGRLRSWIPWSFLKRLPNSLQGLFLRDTTFVQLGYRPFYQAHKVLTIVFWSVVSISILYNGWTLLTTIVSLPA
jgi:hypothetical protein